MRLTEPQITNNLNNICQVYFHTRRVWGAGQGARWAGGMGGGGGRRSKHLMGKNRREEYRGGGKWSGGRVRWKLVVCVCVCV